MKKIKLLIPLAATVAATVPAFTMTSCGDKPTDNKLITSSNSVKTCVFKLGQVPPSREVSVTVDNNEGTVENVKLYDTANNVFAEKITCSVADDGKVTVPLGFELAPSYSTKTTFKLEFVYNDETNNPITETITDLKFNYVIDYGAELLASQYPEQSAATPDKWTAGQLASQYKTYVAQNPNIFQNDARYTTSQRINSIVAKNEGETTLTGVTSFKAYFNDIIKTSDDLLHIHMNYQVKSNNGSKFYFRQSMGGGTYNDWTFNNFNFNFSFEPTGGYDIELDSSTEGVGNIKKFKIIDQSGTSPAYKLDGRFAGSFDYECKSNAGVTTTGTFTANKAIVIDNYSIWDPSATEETKKARSAGMLAFGILHLTYDFEWGTDTPDLTILSPFAKMGDK